MLLKVSRFDFFVEIIDCITTKKSPIYFKDIAGNTYAKQILQEAFVLPNLIPVYFTEGKSKPWNKILLYGVFNSQ